MKSNITVIIPVYKPDEKLFEVAIDSINGQLTKPDNVILVVKNNSEDLKFVNSFIKSYESELPFQILTHEESTSFANQMNIGVKACETDWFVFLEQDDELSTTWIKNGVEYRDAYDDVSIFLPLIIDIDNKNKFTGITNELVWAAEFCDEMGVLDEESLLRAESFNFGGMLMKCDDYLEYGGIKDNIKITFMLEFLLRQIHYSNKLMVIPKYGYKHLNLREGGLFDSYLKTLSPDEQRWWLSVAKKEYFHINDRDIQYTKD